MPEGPIGGPRFTNLGPLSKATVSDIKRQWDKCKYEGRQREICQSIKFHAISALESQNVYPRCDSLIDINSGRCFDISHQVSNELPYTTEVKTIGGDHVWIEYKGRHYDVEVPNGVDNPFDLPFFKRIDPLTILDSAQMEAEMQGIEKPETIEEMIIEVE